MGGIALVACEEPSLTEPMSGRLRRSNFTGLTIFTPEQQASWNGFGADNIAALHDAVRQARQFSASGSGRGAVGLHTGATYLFNGDNFNHEFVYNANTTCSGPGITVLAVGPAGARPILQTTNTTNRRSACILSDDVFDWLHIRGPDYQTGLDVMNDNAGGTGVDGSGKTGWCVNACEIEGFGGGGILEGGGWCHSQHGIIPSDISITHCYIHHNGAAGIQFIPTRSGNIEDNHVYDNAHNGIDVNGPECFIYRNTVYRNGWTRTPMYQGDRCGIFVGPAFVPQTNTIISTNKVYQNRRHGIFAVPTYTGPAIVDTKIVYNECFENLESGILTGTNSPYGTPGQDPTLNRGTEIFANKTRNNLKWGIEFYGAVQDANIHWNESYRDEAGCLLLPPAGSTFQHNNNSCTRPKQALGS